MEVFRIQHNVISNCGRFGISLIEVLVSIAIIGMLIAVVFPAIQSARATSRRLQCMNNQRQLLLGVTSYHDTFNTFPMYTTGNFTLVGGSDTALTSIFPFVGLAKKDDLISSKVVRLSLLECPSDSELSIVATPVSYCVNSSAGRNSGSLLKGPFDGDNIRAVVKAGDISDGMSNTAGISESIAARSLGTSNEASRNPVRYRWLVVVPTVSSAAMADPLASASLAERQAQTELSINDCISGNRDFVSLPFPALGQWGVIGGTLPYSHWLTPNSPYCFPSGSAPDLPFIGSKWQAASEHRGGVNVGFMDGHVRFVSDTINLSVWRAIGTRNGAEAIGNNLE